MPRTLPLLLLTVALAVGCATSDNVRTEPVADLELDKYAGTWFEIAKYPQRFQRGCTCTTARYEPRAEGGLSVMNRCRQGGPAGEVRAITGRAWRPDDRAPGALKVAFFWPLRSSYWVIERGEPVAGPYPWAVVSNEDGDALWILSRRPDLDEATYSRILADLRAQGFDLSRLEETRHDGCWEERQGRVAERFPAP